MKPDGTPISEEEARTWTWEFFRHLKYEPGSGPPTPRSRLEAPMTERLDWFIQLSRDRIRWMRESGPVRIR
jgi:hypothetical protein